MFVDSHAHLEMPEFDSDRPAMLVRAAEAGIEAVLAIGSGPGSLDCAIQLAEKYPSVSSLRVPRILASIGIHPHESKLASDSDFVELEKLSKLEPVIAWGEIGLDYFYDHSPREVQRRVFVQQMELARAAVLPIIIHCRPSDKSENAWEECLESLREHWSSAGLDGILHCFTGSLPHARAALDMGFMISFAGNITFPKSQNIRDVAKEIPLDRILIETDSPFLAPVPHRGKRNEPALVKEVAQRLGELRGMSVEEIGSRTAQNFYFFFQLQK